MGFEVTSYENNDSKKSRVEAVSSQGWKNNKKSTEMSGTHYKPLAVQIYL